MIFVLGAAIIGLLLLLAIGVVFLMSSGKPKQVQSAPPVVQKVAYAPAPVAAQVYVPQLSYRDQVIKAKLESLESVFVKAEKAKFDADTVAEFKTLVQ